MEIWTGSTGEYLDLAEAEMRSRGIAPRPRHDPDAVPLGTVWDALDAAEDADAAPRGRGEDAGANATFVADRQHPEARAGHRAAGADGDG